MKLTLFIFLTLIQLGSCDQIKMEIQEEMNEVMDSGVSVEEVNFSGSENNYTFSVTLKSPDTGCEQYADWWEVVGADEQLIFRRTLGHSHVTEQPFTRSGGAVKILATDIITVRGHMNVGGYGKFAMKGSIDDGFQKVELEQDFATSLESVAPQPPTCAF